MGISRRAATVAVCSALLMSGCSGGEGDSNGWRDPYCGLVEEFEVARVEAVKVNEKVDPSTIAEAIKPVASVRKIVTYILTQAPVPSRTAWRKVERELLKLEEVKPGIAERAESDAAKRFGAGGDIYGSGSQGDARYVRGETSMVVGFFLPYFGRRTDDDLREHVQKDCGIELEFILPPE